MTKYTSGTWSFDIYATDDDPETLKRLGIKPALALTNDGSRSIIAGGKVIAYVTCQTPFKRGDGHKAECSERDANASAISAAPDLIEAVRMALDSKFLMPDDAAEIRSALSRALDKAIGSRQ